ncbi:Lrp/AsnC family transcriptional regulator [Nocardiopsis sp. YSL2]|uniref:Lrp/AsnC family transcriptional regulator n=1 Tax=Nocardiopsis sp. YSL2 TaxID=2939492 RepID=UPI0026F44D3C|nr:AsnC family transcriptional regulator [Nocardiopsis sp. YSL2]
MDELDLMMINAMQLSPRASWTELAEPLGVDASTLSRRWAQLTEEGFAWITCYVGPSQLPWGGMALVEVGCAAGQTEEAAGRIARCPHAVSVEITSGSRDLLVTVAAVTQQSVTSVVLDVLPRVFGVQWVRTTMIVRMARDAGSWRLDSLDPGQRRRIGEEHKEAGAQPRALTPHRELILALGEDGRMPYSELARRTGVASSTLRRRVPDLVRSGRLTIRCDTAAREAGWPVHVSLWLNIPVGRIADVCAGLAAMPETRMAAHVAGQASAVAIVWLHRLEDLADWEHRVAAAHPDVDVVDRAVSLRSVKRTGRLLDRAGRATGHVPMDLWADPHTP